MFVLRMSGRSAAISTAFLLRVACSAVNLTAVEAAALHVPADGEAKTVVIDHFKYQPDTLTVHVGDTVEWKNLDIVPHTATAVNGKNFDSGRIATGASWRFTFMRTGAYEYQCTLHPNMKAKLVVE